MSRVVATALLTVLSATTARAQYPGDEWFLAASQGNVERLKAMLSEDVLVDRRGPSGETALMWAASGGHLEAVTLLLGAGADPEARDESGMTVLTNAAGMGRTEVVRVLLEAGASPNAGNQHGVVPLLAASVGGPHGEVLSALLEAGADLDGLLQHCKIPESAVRVRIVMALAMLGPHAKKAVPQLAEALGDDDLNVRYWAASALKSIGPDATAAVPRLIEALKTHPDRSPQLEGPHRYYADVRWVAADALGEIGSRTATPALREALADESPDVREAAKNALDKLEASSPTK